MKNIAYYNSPLGHILLEATDEALSGLWIVGQKYFPEKYINLPAEDADSQILRDSAAWLDNYFSGRQPDIATLRLAPHGSDFRQDVWKILCSIPYGETVTYGQIAKELEYKYSKKVSAQAVGGAVGHNPISIIIPCHRVIAANGDLTGYAGGLARKDFLLKLEKTDTR